MARPKDNDRKENNSAVVTTSDSVSTTSMTTVGDTSLSSLGRMTISVRELWTLLLMFAAGIAWGLKLEVNQARLDSLIVQMGADHEHALGVINGQLALGILPRADERIRATEERLRALERDVERLQRRSTGEQ